MILPFSLLLLQCLAVYGRCVRASSVPNKLATYVWQGLCHAGSLDFFPDLLCLCEQVVHIVQEQAKLDWLLSQLPAMIDSGEVLVFANQIVRVEEVTERIKSIGHRSAPYYGCFKPELVLLLSFAFLLLSSWIDVLYIGCAYRLPIALLTASNMEGLVIFSSHAEAGIHFGHWKPCFYS